MRRNDLAILIVSLSVSILFATLLTLPRIDTAQPDPYFHVKITPVIYWIGFCLAIFVTLGIVFSKREASGHYGLGLFPVMLLSVYVYVIPHLFYINPIYTDTYIFVGELLYTLRYGHIGWGHSYETPGLALFSSQFSLITGIDHIIVAEILQLVIPLIMIFLVYVVAQLFVSKRIALLACLFSISINWMGFVFNRQSFGLLLFMLVCYLMFKILASKAKILPWNLLLILSFSALVFSHPISSLLVIITAFLVAVFAYLVPVIRRFWRVQEDSFEWRRLMIRAISQTAVFSIIWLLWNTYVGVNIDYAIRTFDETFRGILGLAHIEQPGALTPNYTSTYLPIIGLRMLEMIFVATIGTILAILVLVKVHAHPKNIILSSWFIGCMSLSVFGFYGNWLQLLYRPFLHAYPAFSTLLAWFIVSRNSIHIEIGFRTKLVFRIAKGLSVGIMLFFLLIIPLTMYSHAPFMYPPRVYYRETIHVVQHGNGTIAVFEIGSEYGYYQLLTNASYTSAVPYMPSSNREYRTIMTGYRGYIKDAFFVYTPSLTHIMETFEIKFAEHPSFAKVYDADSWHKVYVNQTIGSVKP